MNPGARVQQFLEVLVKSCQSQKGDGKKKIQLNFQKFNKKKERKKEKVATKAKLLSVSGIASCHTPLLNRTLDLTSFRLRLK